MGNLTSCSRPVADSELECSTHCHAKAHSQQHGQQQQQHLKQQHADPALPADNPKARCSQNLAACSVTRAARHDADTDAIAALKKQQHAALHTQAFLHWASKEATGAQQSLTDFLTINTSIASSSSSNVAASSAVNSSAASTSAGNSSAASTANSSSFTTAASSVCAIGCRSSSVTSSISSSAGQRIGVGNTGYPSSSIQSSSIQSSNINSSSGNSAATSGGNGTSTGFGCWDAASVDCAASIHSSPTSSKRHAPPYEPHDANNLGCPPPACHKERCENADEVNNMRATQDGDMERILAMVCVAFGVDTANISLLTGENIHKCGACGVLKPGSSPIRWGFCGWSFINTHHELLVLENMKDDARVADNFFVTAPDYQLMFYVGAPLISSTGHRLGTLCLFGHKPGKFDATRAQLLANFAELVVRQIEANWALKLQQKRDASQLARSLACYDMAYLLVDVAQPEWRVLYVNKAAQKQLGVEWKVGYEMLPIGTASAMRQKLEMPGIALGDYFILQDAQTVWARDGCNFTIRDAHGAAGTAVEGHALDLEFRLATSDGLDSEQPFYVGVPAWLDNATDGFGQSLFFVQVRESTPTPMSPISSGRCSASALASWSHALSGAELSRAFLPRGIEADECPVDGLVLGPLLGKGSYGRVYRGVYRGLPVAVKIIEDVSKMRTTAAGEPLEAVLTRNVHHLGVMRTITYAYCKQKATCWMLFEYCNRTCVQDAVVKGWFRTNHQITLGTVDIRVVAITAYEIASALAFLHKHDIVHGDLKGGNVMLCSSTLNPHGFTAKVGDFGLSRADNLGPNCPTNKYGTVTHMPPEVLLNGEVSKATDVYSFGVMLWEMLTTARAWQGMRHTQIICQVALMQRQLAMPEGLPAPLQSLLSSCLHPHVEQRCTFEHVLTTLADFLQLSRHQDLSSVRLTVQGDGTWGDDACDSYFNLSSGSHGTRGST